MKQPAKIEAFPAKTLPVASSIRHCYSCNQCSTMHKARKLFGVWGDLNRLNALNRRRLLDQRTKWTLSTGANSAVRFRMFVEDA